MSVQPSTSFAAWPSASKREGTVGAGARAYGPSLEGDTAAARFTITGTDTGGFMGMPPTGKSVTVTGMDFMRFRDGKIVEHWGEMDMLGLLQQLGVIPS